MSRFEVYKGNKGLAFGNDHACGEYIQIWDTTEYRMPDDTNVLVDEDTMRGLTQERALELITKYGFTVEDLAKAYKKGRN